MQLFAGDPCRMAHIRIISIIPKHALAAIVNREQSMIATNSQRTVRDSRSPAINAILSAVDNQHRPPGAVLEEHIKPLVQVFLQVQE